MIFLFCCQNVLISTRLVTQARDSAERTFEWNLSAHIFTVSAPNNDAFITSATRQTKEAFWCRARQDVISGAVMVYIMHGTIHRIFNNIRALRQLQPQLKFLN